MHFIIFAAAPLPFQPLPLRLGQAVIDGDQVLPLHQPSGPDQLHRRPGHAPGTLEPQGLGRQLQLGNALSKGIITQLGPVSNDNFPFLDFFQLLPQLLQGDNRALYTCFLRASMAHTITASS